jgi:hypothetical protein
MTFSKHSYEDTSRIPRHKKMSNCGDRTSKHVGKDIHPLEHNLHSVRLRPSRASSEASTVHYAYSPIHLEHSSCLDTRLWREVFVY